MKTIQTSEKPKPKLCSAASYLYCFDLDIIAGINLHAANHNRTIGIKRFYKKLILPQEQKDLLQILISPAGIHRKTLYAAK